MKACTKLLPNLAGKIDGMALRIPVPDVSAAYLALNVKKKTSAEEVNSLLTKAANGSLKGILAVEEGLLVSSDYISDPHSSTVDLETTAVIDGTLVQVLAWYDNEWGYGMRVTEMAAMIASHLK